MTCRRRSKGKILFFEYLVDGSLQSVLGTAHPVTWLEGPDREYNSTAAPWSSIKCGVICVESTGNQQRVI